MSTPNSRTSYAPPTATLPRVEPPISNNPLRLASATLKAVDQIGENAAAEIESARAQVKEGAQEIDDRLAQLAQAVRDHTRIAADELAAFCDKANAVLETVRELHGRISAQVVEPVDAKANGHEVPAFIRQGNGNGVSHD